MSFDPIDHNFINRNFNDRRKNQNVSKIKGYPHQGATEGYPKPGEKPERGHGGAQLPRKPKTPKSPISNRAVAMKHNLKQGA
ncbi:hypothetical protein UFOVP964_68 [uncultured Caudovirales phage]|uniref:Uncharacterized protein n=1 Tax=uncultured Caudovirales phage TaxID=2100421 RepID=A0A6J5PZL1_9CAUD|nr:hypothetical protein UFOVP854_68 [uncultured Caudovirales phage]CAB4174635.1 hypothetical protein UFOVP964_68 [uncultured Caudovirales phage]CAB4179388.1 hypothetical protein UFOVP1034_90 [uncultured Caudovirales phage]CAB4189134.1 hypothetical protein UFOVP1177_90 [uncultured Caudovirales phage]CAB4193426.1 hypothetical protein UFOVP1243_77 [uncultured Caudovirales phage]